MILHNALEKTIASLDIKDISSERQQILQPLITYIQHKRLNKEAINLNFICTHNSRRSQFAQIWAQFASIYYGISTACFSGGVEVTAFNTRAVDSIKRSGFKVKNIGESENPRSELSFNDTEKPIIAFSKLYNDNTNPNKNFATVMTCSLADANCPFISGAEKRIPIMYDDPKAFDDSLVETEKYDERSTQIANEMFFVFSQIK